MSKIVNIKVSGHSLTKDNNCAGTQHEANATKLIVEFDKDWDEFDKYVTFWDACGKNPTKILLLPDMALDTTEASNGDRPYRIYQIPVPPEATGQAGMITFVIDGVIVDNSDPDNPVATVIKRSVEGALKILPSRKADKANNSAEISATDIQQVIDSVNDSLVEIQEAVTTTTSNKNSAEAASGNAATSESNAATSESNAAASASAASQHKEDAKEFAVDAEGFAISASNHASAASQHKEDAKEFAVDAEGFAISAGNAAESANGAAVAAEQFMREAHGYADDAQNAVLVDKDKIIGVPGEDINVVVENGTVANTVKISADIKQGSISKDKVDDTIITEDDYATNSKKGVVLLASVAHLDVKKGDDVISESLFDVAVGLATHQDMSDNYKPSSLKTCYDMEGIQDKLPASYTAVKEYVDNVADEKADKSDTYTKADVDAKVKNAEVKEGSIGMEHLSDEVLDNLNKEDEGDIVVVHAKSWDDDELFWKENGTPDYRPDKTYGEIYDLLRNDTVVYLDVYDMDFSHRGIPYTDTIRIDVDGESVLAHQFTKTYFLASGDVSVGGVIQYAIDENNKVHDWSMSIPTGGTVNNQITEHVLKLLSDRVHTCEVSGVDYGTDDVGFGVNWNDTLPTNNVIPKGSQLFIQMSDGLCHHYITDVNIRIEPTSKFVMIYGNRLDSDFYHEVVLSELKIVDGSDMYVIFPHSYYIDNKVSEVSTELKESGVRLASGNTDTIELSIENTRTSYLSLESDGSVGIEIPIEDGDKSIKINNTTSGTLQAVWIYHDEDMEEYTIIGANLTDDIDLCRYDTITSVWAYFAPNPQKGEEIEVVITSANHTISTEVKEGSIRLAHFNSETIDEFKGLVLDESVEYAGRTTDTIEVLVSKERTETHAVRSITVPIPINSDDVKCKITNKTTREITGIWVCYDEEENDIVDIQGDLTDEIDLTQYTNLHHLTVLLNGLGDIGETIEATITSANPAISAEVRDSSIGMDKLSDEVKQQLDNAGGGNTGLDKLVSTNTIGITTGGVRTHLFDLANIMTVTIPINSVDTHIELNSSVGLMTVFVNYSDTSHQLFPSSNPFEIDLTQYDGVYEVYVVPTGATMESGELTARITTSEPVVSPEVKDGSIGEQQLSARLKANLVKKTDYATKDVAGVVKVNNYAQGLFMASDGELRVYCAEKSEMTAQNSAKPLAVRFIGHGVTLNTHQEMNDEYDPATLRVSGYTVGIQGQLPASYTAVKGYVDSSISNLIEKLKAAGINID